MEVAYAFLASYGEFSADGKLNLIGGDFDILYTNEVPLLYPLINLVVKIYLDPSDVGKHVEFMAEVLDSRGHRILQEIRNGFDISAPTEPNERHGVGLILGFQQVRFPEFGPYEIRLTLGDLPPRVVPLRVTQRRN